MSNANTDKAVELKKKEKEEKDDGNKNANEVKNKKVVTGNEKGTANAIEEMGKKIDRYMKMIQKPKTREEETQTDADPVKEKVEIGVNTEEERNNRGNRESPVRHVERYNSYRPHLHPRPRPYYTPQYRGRGGYRGRRNYNY
jgi:hypothetical protein